MKLNVEMVNISRLNVYNISSSLFCIHQPQPSSEFLLLEFTAITHAGQKALCMQYRLWE